MRTYTNPLTAGRTTAPVDDESTDLDDLTVKELRARAKDAEIDGYSSMTKSDLIKALR